MAIRFLLNYSFQLWKMIAWLGRSEQSKEIEATFFNPPLQVPGKPSTMILLLRQLWKLLIEKLGKGKSECRRKTKEIARIMMEPTD